MAISDKTRKQLWGKAGSRCAVCRKPLIMPGTDSDGPSIVGDEAHVVAREPDGPRGQSELPLDRRDEYDNLILLCKVHHKLVDDQPNRYTVDWLLPLKQAHEAWVHTVLSSPEGQTQSDGLALLDRIRSGKHLVATAAPAFGSKWNMASPENEQEIELLGDFRQYVVDYIDIHDELGSKDLLRQELYVNGLLKELEASGFLVYGCIRPEPIPDDAHDRHAINTWSICVFFVVRKTDARLKRKPDELESIVAGADAVQDEFTNFVVANVG